MAVDGAIVLDPAHYRASIYALPPLVVGVLTLGTGLVVCIRKRFDAAARGALWVAWPVGAWMLGYVGVYSATDPDVAMFWARAGYTGTSFLGAGVFAAAVVHLGVQQRHRVYRAVYWAIGAGFAAAAVGTNTFLTRVEPHWWGFYPRYGLLGVPFVLYLTVTLGHAFWLYRSEYRKADPASVHGRRMRGMFAALLVAHLAAVDLFAKFGIPLYPFGYAPIFVFVVIYVYTVGRYDLPDITAPAAADQILATMADALVVLDRENTVRVVNPAACALLGAPAGALVGSSLQRLAAAGVMRLTATTFEDDASAAVAHEMVLAPDTRDERTFSLSLSPMRRADALEATVCLLRDITGVKALQRELEDATLAAEAATRAKSDFLATVSHEVRTPMHVVFGMTEMLLDTPLDDEQRACAAAVQRNATSLLAIIDDILDLSKIEARALSLEAAPFAPRSVFQDVVDGFALHARTKQLALTCDVDRSVPRLVCGDATRLRQVITNLVGNALKFTEHGGVDVRVRSEGGVLHIAVADTGIGIPVERQAEIFEAFAQADASTTRRFGGTGLGLTICRQLVAMMHGQMCLESEPGRGSTFHVAVPLAAVREAATDAA